MNDARLVNSVQRFAQIKIPAVYLFLRNSAFLLRRRQSRRIAVGIDHQIHHQIRMIVFDTEVVNPYNPGMTQPVHRPRLGKKAFAEKRGVAACGHEHLHRITRLKLLMNNFVHFTHPATADRAEHTVGTDSLSCLKCHMQVIIPFTCQSVA